jgi:hypothetical protein
VLYLLVVGARTPADATPHDQATLVLGSVVEP